MLHSCDAGEKSVITAYVQGFDMEDLKDPNSEFKVQISNVAAMRYY